MQPEIKDYPAIDELRDFWADKWEKETLINLETNWYRELEDSYCTKVLPKNYTINKGVFDKVIYKMANNKAPGNDLIIPFWIKRLTSLHPILLNLYTSTKSSETEIPDWLAISRTILQPKNTNTHMAKNYRPIACLNIMYKLYTGIINQFINEHCSSKSIITVEHAGGKRGSWGFSEQLLIN